MIELTIALIAFLVPLAYSPGPGNLFFAANGARFGARRTLPANAGYHVATILVTLAIGMGFGAIATRHPQLLVAIRYLGSAYVLYLAYRMYRAGAVSGTGTACPAGFADGAVLLLLNPKAYVIIALMFSQFTPSGEQASASLVIAVSVIFTLNNFVAFSIWAIAGDVLVRVFATPSSAHRLNTLFAVTLALVAVWMLLP